jgi:hypothetical protein
LPISNKESWITAVYVAIFIKKTMDAMEKSGKNIDRKRIDKDFFM